ncbi:C2 family cysteine protease [Legionella erythra]|uniref:Coiled-coil protein n=1 Tax=Legionella erythra TaxID=448 RepID=A0A0W0TQD7_LEGER|nr:C2 family cysteine protease [Legionella erythra]KTC97860.1 coiled-coil protein [Legionella erythra]
MPHIREIQSSVNNPVGELGCFAITHTPYEGALFPDTLKLSDIEQGGRTGDCYFLSVLCAILALPDGEKLIRQQMIEKDGQIHVLFFRHEQPEWVVIEKSLPKSTGLLSSGPVWVRFLEKAYVVLNGGNYNVLSSGDCRKVLRAFLGDTAMAIATSLQSRKPLAELYQSAIEGCSGKDVYALIFLLRPYDAKTSIDNINEHVFNGNKTQLKAWLDWIARNRDKWQQLLNKQPILYEETLIDFLEKEKRTSDNPPVEAINAVKTWLVNRRILPCKAHYSQDELGLYDELKQALENQNPVVASPGSNPPSGIIMEHTYAVLSVRESQLSHRKFVTLRNPYAENRSWLFKLFLAGGRQAREWQDPKTGTIELRIDKTQQSTFEMELHDFAHAFLHIDKGQSLKTAYELQATNALMAYGI